MKGPFGAAIKRREDPELITGRGRYTDDLTRPGMLHAVVVRSQHAHGKILDVDVSGALEAPGVVAVYTGKDVEASEIGGVVPTGWLLPEIKTPAHPILATDRVRYVGDGVAVVVADTRAHAVDAAERVFVEIEPLDAVVDPKAATADGAPRLFEEAPNNVSFDWSLGRQAIGLLRPATMKSAEERLRRAA